jgi:hypothetical protein
MDLLMRLEGEAQAAGGYVHVLIGNHESMNMIGDMRYVSKDEYAAFAADETPEQRNRWFDAYERRQSEPSDPTALRERFDATFPAGFFALREALGPTGKYGKWLLSKPVIVSFTVDCRLLSTNTASMVSTRRYSKSWPCTCRLCIR